MNVFLTAYKETLNSEGKYSNNTLDTGKETFMGISRKFYPNWEGWFIIDELKKNNTINNIPQEKQYILDNLAQDFYKKTFWDAKNLNLNRISNIFPDLAIELFDIAVNMGITTAGKFLQRALNLLNRNGKDYKDLIIDGLLGNNTLTTLSTYSTTKDAEKYIFKTVSLLKGAKYIEICESNNTQEVFLRGWINRVKLYVKR